MKKVLQALAEMQVKMPIQTVLLVLLVAFLVSLIIYLTYKNTYTGVLYNLRFNVSLMITTMVMVVIGSNISVSLGMVGALSIIRFRTAVKDPRDTAFIFWCVVSGLACGTQNYTIVIVGSIFICLILFLFKKFITKNNKYVLIIKGKSFDLKEVEKTLDKKLKDYICKGKYISVNGMETIYDVKIKDSKISDDIIVSLSKVSGVNTINIVSSNTDTMG